LYDKDNSIPITISIKTSCRERYKQADLEAYAFKNVHRTALNYLLVLNESERLRIQDKINRQEVLGLKEAINASSSRFDSLVEELKNRRLGTPPRIDMFAGRRIRR
jgi:hypothetical protein